MLLSTSLIILVEILLLSFLFFHYLTYRKDLSRLRFLVLTACFINYNIWSGLLPDSSIGISLFFQSIIEYTSGIVLACYYYFYLVVELRMAQEKYFNVKNLIIILFGLFFIFIIGNFFFDKLGLAQQVFLFAAILVSVMFCVKTIKLLVGTKNNMSEDNMPHRLMLVSGYVGIIFMASMPINVFFGDVQILDVGLVNVSFILAFYAYFRYQTYLDKLRHELIESVNANAYKPKLKTSYNLSERELEVADLILKDIKFFAISEKLNIAEKTVSKHASNIYRKTETHNKFEFIQKYA